MIHIDRMLPACHRHHKFVDCPCGDIATEGCTMSLSWFSDRSLKVSPKVRLVEHDESDALRRKLESVDWQPAQGFLKDQVQGRAPFGQGRGNRAA